MSELTEDQKLVKLGLRAPNQTQSAGAETIVKFQDKIASEWATFQENFEDANLGSFADFETWLANNGFTSEQAATIRNTFESKYASWSEFSDKVLNDFTSWSDFENDFASNTGLRSDRDTDSGLSAGGIKIYEEAGVGRSGQSIPAGGVEVYGSEVHFSQSTAVKDTLDESAGTDDPIVWNNLTVESNVIDRGELIDVSADLTNNADFVVNVVAVLIEDGSVINKKTREVSGNTTITVTFEYASLKIGTFDVGISTAGTEEVTVIQPDLI